MVLCIWIYITRLPQSTDITEYDQVVDSLRNLTRMRQMNDLVAKLTVSVPLIRFNATGLALNKYTKRVIMVLTSGPKQEERIRAIQKTWGAKFHNETVVHYISDTNSTELGIIGIKDIPDISYANNFERFFKGLSWVHEQYPQIELVNCIFLCLCVSLTNVVL